MDLGEPEEPGMAAFESGIRADHIAWASVAHAPQQPAHRPRNLGMATSQSDRARLSPLLPERGIAWLLAPAHPANLAVFRIATCLAWLIVLNIDESLFFADWPRPLMGPRNFWLALGWPSMHNQSLVLACGVLAHVALVLGILGLFARPALIVLLICGGYVVTIPQFAGSTHHFNHVLQATMLLIASPCDHALALRRPRDVRGSTPRACSPSVAYALPLRAMVLILGIAYFFAGVWKLVNVGTFWLTSTNFINQLHTKWHEFHTDDLPLRIDHWPLLCMLGAIGTVVIELGWGVLALSGRKGRGLAALGATFFHATTWYFLRINFMHLALMQVILFDWHRIGCWLWRRSTSAITPAIPSCPAHHRDVLMTLILGSSLLVGMLLNGALKRNDWPLGCYPRFDRRAHDRLNVLIVTASLPDGSTRTFREDALHPYMRTSRARATFERAMRDDASVQRDERLRSLWSVLVRIDPAIAYATRVEFVRQSESIRPGSPDARDRMTLMVMDAGSD